MRLHTRFLMAWTLLCASVSPSFAATIGARTVTLNNLKVEVWYPSSATPAANVAAKNYDIRLWLPPADQKKIPDAKVPPQVCDCYADLPLDSEHGPYPVILFAHGTGGFRTQTLSLMSALASRGFVVLAADHPGLYLGDLLQLKFGAKVPTDLQNILSALRNQDNAVAFLKDHIALDHIGLIGHSAGGNAVAGGAAWKGVEFIAPIAAGGTQSGAALKGSLILGALNDKVVAYDRQQTGYDQSPSPKRLVGLKNAGHLAFSDLCALKNKDGEDLVTVAKAYKVTNVGFASGLWDGCAAGQLDPVRARTILNEVVGAAAEEALRGFDKSSVFSDLQIRHPEVGDLLEDL